MYIFYNILVTFLFILLVLPYFLYRLVVEKGFGHRFRQAMGLVHREEIEPVAGTGCIWLHGASVGEMVALSPLVKEIKNIMPEKKVLVSAVTVGGYDMARQIMPEADAIINYPMDLPLVASTMVRRIRPGIFIMVETELWPNFLRAIREQNIPAMMMNGRISEKSAKSYRYLSGFLRDMLDTVNLFCMQSSIDAKYIAQLGADPGKIVVTGNTKFDQTYAEVTAEDLAAYKTELGLGEDAFPIIVAGSTHRSEEEAVLVSFTALRKKYPHARLIIAPRKLNRIEEIKKVNAKFGYAMACRSKLKEIEGRRPEFPVLLLDTIGELGRIYAVGDIVFVGGSLVHYGGHNVLEPAAHAKPILVGPSMEDFKDSYSLLSRAGACRRVSDADGLTEAFLEIAGDDVLRKKMGDASIQIIRENRGAAQRTIHYLTDLLGREI
ncbi:MAG: 3-deoxy-D-manno-octulosonic acid transferase [Acidaminococcaceae bacterium]|nr:3-deoxy-D-manno-octulosonic acid transferase [Acidaminococcaceae bacterium]